MPIVHVRRTLGGLALACFLVGCAGCSGNRDYAKFIPSEPAARRVLEIALRAWQEEQPERISACKDPALQVVDVTHRRPGQKLRQFEILGEVMADGPRRFAVRLTLDNPSEEQKVRYLVVGKDPLWVFREEEYEMLIHWECIETKKEEDPRPSGSGKESAP